MTTQEAQDSGALAGVAMRRGKRELANTQFRRMVEAGSDKIRDIWQAAYRAAFKGANA